MLEGNDDFLISDEIKIVLAGPLFNFFVAIFCYLCFWFEPETYIFLYDTKMFKRRVDNLINKLGVNEKFITDYKIKF